MHTLLIPLGPEALAYLRRAAALEQQFQLPDA